MINSRSALTLLLFSFWACSPPQEPVQPLFQLLSETETGISFRNDLNETVDFNILNYLYFYNGGGVAIGDINNDDLPDIYFSANQSSNKLYLNKGNLQFEDISESAGIEGTGNWSTGVSMVDVNGDGLLDIYQCHVGNYQAFEGKNQLFINLGNNTFEDQAARYGLDFQGLSTQVCFLDYDRDGDLDMYLLNHSVHAFDTYKRANIRQNQHPTAGDRLFRNDGEIFTDVTQEAGIYSSEVGYGLGITSADVNNDGWPDLYICNDFHEDDYLYLNNQDGTFREVRKEAIGHTSRFSMGVDIADMNNDGMLDILSLDMKPEREDILKTSEGPATYDLENYRLRFGYSYQYPRNALQLNRGIDPQQPGVPQFSEIAQLAGVDATDWSWSALMADFDLDGQKDIFITNGIYRRPNDMDYIKFLSNQEVARSLNAGITPENLKWIEKMPSVKVLNYAFKNEGNLTFSNQSQAWGLDQEVFSNGAAYADLDNDGDLDLVVNNVNEQAFIYQNKARERTGNYFLTIKLNGKGKNTAGIGTQVKVQTTGRQIFQEVQAARGWQSSSCVSLNVGLGKDSLVLSVEVIWPDQTTQLIRNPKINSQISFDQSDAQADKLQERESEFPFQEIANHQISFTHREDPFNDFASQPLMPHQLSKLGPALAVADLNRDGLDDFFIGGAMGQAGALYMQDTYHPGQFLELADFLWQPDSQYEDVDAVFFDANGDSLLDLYVASAGNQHEDGFREIKDRLYLCTQIVGAMGRRMVPIFERADSLLPNFSIQTACVRPGDFDGDGDLDLFIGGRSIAQNYGKKPRSLLLENDGKGHFTDVTQQKAPQLQRVGMVTDAVWTQLDASTAEMDLLIVGEWMAPQLFSLQENQLAPTAAFTPAEGQFAGWWNSLEVLDFDGDGDLDFFAGNLGKNSVLKASKAEPTSLYVADFDRNRSLDHIIAFYKKGKNHPFATRDELLMQLAPLKKQFPTYESFAGKEVNEIWDEKSLTSAMQREASTFSSFYFENTGKAQFEAHELPRIAQIAPIMDFEVIDLAGDGKPEIAIVGNNYAVGPNIGRYDAGYGLILSMQDASLSAISPAKSGFWAQGDARAVKLLRSRNRQLLLVVHNNGGVQVWEL